MRIGIPAETFAGEKRVATVPEVVEKLVKLGFKVTLQSGAGDAANFSDDTYKAAGAEIAPDAQALWSSADIVFKVRAPSADEVGLMRAGQALISFIWPAQNPELMQQLAARKVTVLAMDALPRMLSRAQKMDALTSMAGITGYRAVIEAAHAFGRFLTGQVTAAGKVPPAKDWPKDKREFYLKVEAITKENAKRHLAEPQPSAYAGEWACDKLWSRDDGAAF